ncbi:4-coumarate--CoA ligase-like 7 isoform X2 [Selaginella moellendorffii]|uniref:4-coumarate--CoA ligase-like 7 isoform X2 n=1 Tax=Selaginella moellendorffii TaxID=88036 RepID=UPI000D1C6731|nr:4-coumarate--CoA ligase-like 7 isoform X2 [Selaginella moellendorffii]|eukprot:XP_024519846.1 4-coumarate--CoA ligase-like 7 isoform X2 [Selaginella moellendorffii]
MGNCERERRLCRRELLFFTGGGKTRSQTSGMEEFPLVKSKTALLVYQIRRYVLLSGLMAAASCALQTSMLFKGHQSQRKSYLVFSSMGVTSKRKVTSAAYDRQSGIYASDRCDIVFPEGELLDFATFVSSKNILNPANNVALMDGVTGRELTFDQVMEETVSLATCLHHLGIEQGDVVMLLAPNSIYYPLAVMAIARIGAVVATPSPMGSAKDVEFQARLANAKMVITTSELLFKTRGLGLETIVMDDDGSFSLAEDPGKAVKVRASSTVQPRIHRDDPAAILYSSGTTGMSKAVVLSHANVVAQILQLAREELYESALAGRKLSYDVPLCALPMSHIFGLVAVTLKQLYLGNRLVILPGFELRTMLAAVESYRISHIYVVPPVIITLAKFLQKTTTMHDFTSLRASLCGAAPLGEDLVLTLSHLLPNAFFFQLYGITEATGALTLNDTVASGNTASAGTLLSNVEAKVLDVRSGAALPPNCQGELFLRSPTTMLGYISNPEATKLSIISDDWLRTGDLVYFDDAENLFVVDRIKELIKYKTLQVAPAELEALILTHPLVLDAAVVASKDEEAGEIPVAFVVPSADGELTEDEVRVFVARNVAAHKRVRRVTFIDAIPKTPSGKILRKDLALKA